MCKNWVNSSDIDKLQIKLKVFVTFNTIICLIFYKNLSDQQE